MNKLVSFLALCPFALCAATYYATPNPTYDGTGTEIVTKTQTVSGVAVDAWSLSKCNSLLGNKSGTIVLLKGTYDCTKLSQYEAGSLLEFKKANLGSELIGETGDPKDVVLVGGGTENSFRCIYIYGSSTRIKVDSITFTNFCSSTYGGAIYGAAGAANTIVTNCCFFNNTAKQGGAIFFSGSQMEVWNCLFRGNRYTLVDTSKTTTGGGGAIFGAGLACTNCRFFDNGHPNPETQNRATGGAVWSVVSTNCVYAGNTAYGAGAIGFGSKCYKCVISNNTAYSTMNVDKIDYIVSNYVPCDWCDFISNTNRTGAITGGNIKHCRYIDNVGKTIVNGGSGDRVGDSLFFNNEGLGSGDTAGLVAGSSVYNTSCISNIHPNRVLSSNAQNTPVVNVLFAGNLTSKGGATLANPTRGSWHTVTNCVGDKATNSSGLNWVTDAKVATYVKYDTSGIPCGVVRNHGSKIAVIDRGFDIGSTATDLDLAGNPRVFGAAIDIGCYECQDRAPGLMLLVR